MIARLSIVIVTVIALAGGCKGKAGGETMGTFTCREIKDDACVGPTDTFEATVPAVYVSYKTKTLPKNGDIYTIRWIAEDVGSAAPANTTIATLNEEVKDAQAGTKNYVVNTHLTQPTAGWPVGKYRVEVAMGDKTLTTAKFSIK